MHPISTLEIQTRKLTLFICTGLFIHIQTHPFRLSISLFRLFIILFIHFAMHLKLFDITGFELLYIILFEPIGITSTGSRSSDTPISDRTKINKQNYQNGLIWFS